MPPKVQRPLKLKIKKPKLLRSNPLRKSLIISGSDPDTTVDDEDIYVSYRRPEVPEFKPIFDDDEELSDYVKTRLFIARALAMKKYYETQGTV